jgi:hypothetical protein
MNKDAFSGISTGYKNLMKLIEEKPDARINSDTAVEFQSAAQLLNDNYLFASTNYRQFVTRVGGRKEVKDAGGSLRAALTTQEESILRETIRK